MANFVHLHCHTEYSLLDGISKIPKLIKTVKELGMPGIAITDHGVMYGAIEFYKACKKEEIKPIIGCELYVAKRSHKDKESKVDNEPYHLTVLAKDFEGYKNLMKLVSIAHLEGYYYKPRVDKELLKIYHQGLIALSGCPAGEFIRNIKEASPASEQGDFKEAEEVAKTYIQIFGEDNFYFELQNHEYQKILKENQNLDPLIRQELEEMSKIQDLTWKAVKTLSQKLGIPYLATNDFHYVKPSDATAQDAVLCVQTGHFVKEIKRLRMIDTPNLYVKSEEEMRQLFFEMPEAIENTLQVVEKVNLEMNLGKPIFPLFEIPGGATPIEQLKKLAWEGFQKKFPQTNQQYQARLEYELSVIEGKKFAVYILIVADFINWAHSQGIITNTRGSAAGSLVLYCLGVTNIDPIAYKLPFERFMNPMRPKFPDIDSDIADDRRDEVIQYVTEKYGENKVAQIITFGTMMGRAAIRDIGRVLGMSYGEVDRIAKLVPPPRQGFHQNLGDALKGVPELDELYKSSSQVKELIDLAQKVEGTVRHASVHAAGLVISPEEMTNYAPLQKESNGEKIISQYDMFSISEEYEGVGLIKIDLLGIRNLSILGHAVDIVRKNRGIQIDLNKLPLDDKKTFEMLTRGDTMGVFQLEGSGMTRYLVDLRPTNIFDLSAMVALYRPGPLSIIPDYISRKHNPAHITYFDERMKDYLEESLGLLVYQDDVLLTTINIAGYNWEEADKFRKAMGKKIPEEMAKQKDHFIEGCVKNGLLREKAEELFKLIEPFAAYGFNKAHAASYAMVAYQTAYMKANFPVEFMAAVMTAEYGDEEKIAHAMEECKRIGVVVLPPDVNKSEVGFSIEGQTVRFGLSAIKNVGILAIQSILKAREKSDFKSFADLVSKVDNRLVNKKTLESLIKSGAMDSLGKRAAQLLILDECIEKAHKIGSKGHNGQVGLFAEDEVREEVSIKLPDVEELSLDQLLAFEKNLLGFYLHEPPFAKSLQQIEPYISHKISDLTENLVGQKTTLGGVILEIKKVTTKKTAAEMAFVKLSDGRSSIEVVVFPKLFETTKANLEKDQVVLVGGKVDKRDDQLSFLANTIEAFDPSKTLMVKKEIEVVVPSGTGIELLQKINKTLRQSPGLDTIHLLLPNGGNNLKKMTLPFGVKMDSLLIAELEGFLGKGIVKKI